jgi:HAD superfamily hydrolase (TIGR01662 family)
MQEYHLQRECDHLEFSSEYVLRCLLHRYGFDFVPRDHLRTALDHLYAVTETNWLIEEDTIPTLNELLKSGYRLGIISNAADDHDVQMLIDQHNLRSYFSVILVSAAMGIRKPHPRIFQQALDFFEIPPHKAVMVGDTLNADILGAINIGMDCVWITRRADTSDNRILKDSIHPNKTISKLSELPDILQNLSSHPGHQSTKP